MAFVALRRNLGTFSFSALHALEERESVGYLFAVYFFILHTSVH
jgi:uncharacterized membrane protein